MSGFNSRSNHYHLLELSTSDAWYKFFSTDTNTNNYVLVMVDTDKITNNFTFLVFWKKELITCSVCTADGKKVKD